MGEGHQVISGCLPPFLYEWSELEMKLIPDPMLGSGLFKVGYIYRHGRSTRSQPAAFKTMFLPPTGEAYTGNAPLKIVYHGS